jgi:Flp pilus assembly protein TadG
MRERGTAIVELALLLPLLMLLMLGMIELGRFIYFGILVGNAAHAGAQFGAQSLIYEGDFTGMESAAQNDAQNMNIPLFTPTASDYCQCWDGTTATAATCGTTCPSGSTMQTWVSVTGTGQYQPLFNYPGLPTSWTVTRTANMLVAP